MRNINFDVIQIGYLLQKKITVVITIFSIFEREMSVNSSCTDITLNTVVKMFIYHSYNRNSSDT